MHEEPDYGMVIQVSLSMHLALFQELILIYSTNEIYLVHLSSFAYYISAQCMKN